MYWADGRRVTHLSLEQEIRGSVSGQSNWTQRCQRPRRHYISLKKGVLPKHNIAEICSANSLHGASA